MVNYGEEGNGIDPTLIEFDPDLPWDEQQGMNRGCPPGYAAQFVGVGEPLSIPLRDGLAVRCRRIEGITAEQIKNESGTTKAEAAGILTGAVADTFKQVRDALEHGFRVGGPLVTLGLLAVIGVSVAVIVKR